MVLRALDRVLSGLRYLVLVCLKALSWVYSLGSFAAGFGPPMEVFLSTPGGSK